MNNYILNETYNGFKLISSEYVVDINSETYLFEHVKTGAKLIYIKNDDSNKVFNIAFRTPPSDDTGVMHILEHSVLAGSRKFPVKEPFVELAKGSLNTYLNAFTGQDYTFYPVASTNEKDLTNLMDVYLDAVFYPTIYNNDLTFKQEGWHHHIENIEDDITYRGVVYNEMRGVYSSPEELLHEYAKKSLFPDTHWSYNSGGNPKNIPDLTYNKFIDTHKKYYHPSNSYILLYGDLDANRAMEFINNEYLSNFDRCHIDMNLPTQKPFKSIKHNTYKYSVSTEEDISSKNLVGIDWCIDIGDDMEAKYAMMLLISALVDSSDSPLKKALIDLGFGAGVNSYFMSSAFQPYASVSISNVPDNMVDRFEDALFDILNDIVKEGINKSLLEGCLNTLEFQEKELNNYNFPLGLSYAVFSILSWMNGMSPIDVLKTNKVFDRLRELIKTSYFEDLIKKFLIDNPHACITHLKPQLNLAEEENKIKQEQLCEFKKSLSKSEIKSLVDKTNELLAYQSTEDSKENLEKIPLLSLEDISIKDDSVDVQEHYIDNAKVLHSNVFTRGISYIQLMFNVNVIPQEDLQYVGLLTKLLGVLATKTRSKSEVAADILLYTGGITAHTSDFLVNSDDTSSINNYTSYITVSSKMLTSKINEGLNLLFDIISNPDFEDNKEIKKRISEFIAISSGNFASYGHAIALERLASYWAAPAKYKDYVTGIDFLHFVKQIDKDFDNVFEGVKEKLYKVARLLFNKNNLLIAVTGDMESLTAVKKYLPDNIQSLNNAAIDIYTHKFDTENLKEGLMVDSDVQYVAAGYNYKLLGYEYSYSLEVLNSMLKYGYLWNNIRVKGGAYGIITQLSKEGRYAFVSYRDPNLKETLDTYNQMAEYVESLEMSDRELTKAIIGTVGALYKPLSPRLLGQKAINLYLSNTQNDFEEKLQGILNTKVEDLRTFAPMIKDIFNQDYTVVVGSNSKIKEASGMFLNTYNPLTTKVKQDNIS